MSELISGKEAKLAWAEGVDVQVATGPDKFRTLVSSDDLGIFDCGNYFRLKPHTITINGIEVPKPFEPKKGEKYFYLTDEYDGGYGIHNRDNCTIEIAAWRNEEEIRQVVVALRSIFK